MARVAMVGAFGSTRPHLVRNFKPAALRADFRAVGRIKTKFGHDRALRRSLPRAARLRCALGVLIAALVVAGNAAPSYAHGGGGGHCTVQVDFAASSVIVAQGSSEETTATLTPSGPCHHSQKPGFFAVQHAPKGMTVTVSPNTGTVSLGVPVTILVAVKGTGIGNYSVAIVAQTVDQQTASGTLQVTVENPTSTGGPPPVDDCALQNGVPTSGSFDHVIVVPLALTTGHSGPIPSSIGQCGLVSFRVYAPASVALDALSHIALSLTYDGKTQPVNVFLGQGGAGAEIDWSTELAQPGVHQLVLTMKLASDVSEAGLSGKAGQTFKWTVTFVVAAVRPK